MSAAVVMVRTVHSKPHAIFVVDIPWHRNRHRDLGSFIRSRVNLRRDQITFNNLSQFALQINLLQTCREPDGEMEITSATVPFEKYNGLVTKYNQLAKVSSATVPAEAYEKLVTKYNELAERHRNVSEEHAKCKDWNAQYYEKYKIAKRQVHDWQHYIDKKQGKHATPQISSSPPKTATENLNPPRVSSSQTTEADEESTPPTAHEPVSDDEPVFVSTRSVKRKRNQSPSRVHIKQEHANSPQNPINIASEAYSSPELKRQKLSRVETSDLDACVHRMDTPRKRKHTRGASEEVVRPPPLPVNTSSLSEGDLDGGLDYIAFARDEKARTAHDDPTVTARDFAATVQGNRNALQPRSINIPGNSRGTSIQQAANPKQKRGDPRKIAILSEDGEDDTGQVTTPVPQALPPEHIKQRLGNLLDEPTPERQPLSARRPPVATTPRPRESEQSPWLRNAKNMIEGAARVPHKIPSGLEPPPPDPSPEDEPLRDRPWYSLQLDDFRINPSFMGTNYAFSETFRGREQRRCLVGCTRPECCGDTLRKTIEMGAAPTRQNDGEVLEAYLGRNHAQIMASYSPDKRKDVLVQARTQALANQYSKHRHAYERPRTPPGFWRTDMPSTQEAEQDRARAHEMHLQKVEERWREAMRDGGRWLFRDE